MNTSQLGDATTQVLNSATRQIVIMTPMAYDISILTFFAKVFEKLLYKYLLDFVDYNDMFYVHQFGSRKKYSTQQAIFSLIKKVTGAWDSIDIAIGAFLDVRKAFDTVPHDILLKMLYVFEIVGSALKLPKRYLTDRTQSKIYGGIQSVTLPISCRVPQGSRSKD